MKATSYKLAEYKIIEYDTGELRWERHYGLGVLQEGSCFKKGAILFIGPAENDGPGFLILEFSDNLKTLSVWGKTKYYCRSLEIYHCKNGKRVTKEEMLLWILDLGINEGERVYSEKPGQHSNNIFTKRATGDVTFRLQRYGIIKKTNGQIVWKTHAGPNTVNCGDCIILEDILFIGSWKNEQLNLDRRQFLENLQQLTIWDQTKYYCPKLSLHECKTANRVWGEKKRLLSDKEATATNYAGKGYTKITESKISPNKPPRIISARKSASLQVLVKSVASRAKSNRFFWCNFKKPDVSKSIAIFRTSVIKKSLTCSAVLILLTILLIMFFFFGYWAEHDEKKHHKKEDHSSSHREHH